MIFSYFQFLVYILFFNTQRLKQFNVLFCCCPREQLCKYTHSQRILIPCSTVCASICNPVNFSVQRCASALFKYWNFGVKVATFMLTNTILRQLFLCPTAASVPNPLLTRLAAMSPITQRHRDAVHTPPAYQPRTQSGVN